MRARKLPTERTRHSPKQIFPKLRKADLELDKWMAIPEVCKALGVSETTHHLWRNLFGGIKADEAWQHKELENDNARLKTLVAELALGKAIFFGVSSGNS